MCRRFVRRLCKLTVHEGGVKQLIWMAQILEELGVKDQYPKNWE